MRGEAKTAAVWYVREFSRTNFARFVFQGEKHAFCPNARTLAEMNKNAEVLLKHFDCIGKAPDAVPLLRRFILDLVVRGKLVAQDETDEPASELLTRIAEASEAVSHCFEDTEQLSETNNGRTR
jgi:hypothetical protein